MAIIPILASESLLHENENYSNKILPPVSIEPLALLASAQLGLGLGACWTWNPDPVVQYSLGVIFCYCNFLFSCSKDSEVNIGIIAILVHFEKTLFVETIKATINYHRTQTINVGAIA